MITNVKISEIDKKSLLSHELPSDLSLKDINFSGVVVNKPWGYEYLMFTKPHVSIWMLYIKKGYCTSMHCHPNKKTSLFLILGEAICSTLNEKFNIKEGDALIFEKGVFHTTEAVSENGIFVMEVETPTDKTDLFRLSDKYQREMRSYTNKKNITDKTYNYHYLFLENWNNSTNIFGKYKFLVRNFKNNEDLHKEVNSIEPGAAIILSGEIKTPEKIMTNADIIETKKLSVAEIISPANILFVGERKNVIKVSDYIISFLEKKGVKDVFLVSGGNLIHLLESIRTNKNMGYICNHHEQASAMSAESYSKMKNDIGVAMVTSGPGGTNAITGVAGAWIDSNPALFISGQSNSTQTIGNSKLRQMGVQEIDIVNIVRPITKYAVMVRDPKKIRYHLEKAVYLATHGRPGPVWLDIPINIQLTMLEEKELLPFKIPGEFNKPEDISQKVSETIKSLETAERPIILLGNGVRLAKAEKEFFELADKLSIPIVTSRNANDMISEDYELYAGRVGSFGQRAANFAIQNADLMLSIGSRIGLAVTGWAYNDFSRGSKKIVVDIDPSELKKPNIKPDISINCNAKDFISCMLDNIEGFKQNFSGWKEKINYWKKKYPIILPEHKNTKDSVNTYYFVDILSDELSSSDAVVTDMGMAFQCTMQAFKIKKGQRLYTSAGHASMGWGLPGAIGACMANNKKRTICITGDGGLMMNIQELQTIAQNKLPIKIFIFNNNGYSSIRETQKTYFEGLIASDSSCGVSMPDFIKVAESYGLKAKRIVNQDNLAEEIKEVLNYDGPFVCDINISEKQEVQPKQGAFKRPDGKTVPRPIEDMLPYIPREEFDKEMIIDPVPFELYKGEN